MSGYRQAEEYIPKFLSFIRDKRIVKDFSINKEVLRQLYTEEFKLLHNVTKLSFSCMFSHMRYFGVAKYGKSKDIVIFNSEIFNTITPDTSIAKRKTFKIAPHIRTQQTSKVYSVSNEDATKSQSKSSATAIPEECRACGTTHENAESLRRHQESESHILRKRYLAKTKLKPDNELYAEVVDGFGGGKEEIVLWKNERTNIQLNLMNNSASTIYISEIVEVNPSLLIDFPKFSLPRLLPGKSQLLFQITVYSTQAAFHHFPILFKLKKQETSQVVEVVKELAFHVISPLVSNLRPTSPYIKMPVKRVTSTIEEDIVKGVHADKQGTDFKPRFPLQQYRLPEDVITVLNNNLKEFNDMTQRQYYMIQDIKGVLNQYEQIGTVKKDIYFKLLQILIMMEEYQMRINIRMYDAENQTLTQGNKNRPNILELKVPGLAEHRPSVLRGDSIFVKTDKNSTTKYEGIVHRVNIDSVILGFGQRFGREVHLPNKKYFVTFTFNRVALRAEFQAIELVRAHNIIPLLCSETVKVKPLEQQEIKWFNSNIQNNEKQQQAVQHILLKTSHPMPYLIFGPPGTGKTVTIVEAILQIWKNKPGENMLVCAPSNSAANEITKRLVKHVPQRGLLRYIAPSYAFSQIGEDIRPYTNHDGADYYHPPIADILTYRIVVVTLVNASRLVNGGTPLHHFSYVFIDESGQATESETLIPIAGILTGKEKPGAITGQIVLAGDPKQLGPIIHSFRAMKYGYGMSMLERFMTTNAIYQKKKNAKYNEGVLTKLVKSYRSHPTILSLPNKLFYDGELQAAGDDLTLIAESWDELPNPKFPVIFHSVMGKDEQEKNSPSFFNVQEVDVIVDYLEKLINNRLNGMLINESHIGIITPYRKQVEKLKRACERKRWEKLTIGTVEQFQGQERLITIISTVRTKPEFMTYDEKYYLGFVKNPKRFNVALTRAKALLIVVGNPNILQTDKYWWEFIKYCKDHKSCKGMPFELNSNDVDLSSIKISESPVTNGHAREEGPNFSRGNI